MSQIRKRSLKAATWIYVGFLIGALNTYFLTHKNWFQPDEYGLSQGLVQIALLVFALSSLGVTSYLYKFFPYYEDNVEANKNDILSLALVVSIAGFILTSGGIYFLKPLVIQKLNTNSPLLVSYFYLAIPFGFFILLYTILEAYSYGFHKGVVASLLKETILRSFTLVVILLKIFGYINFHTFILLFCLQYAVITLILAAYLYKEGKLWLNFKVSKVTRRFRKKIITIMLLTYMVVIVTTLRGSIDALVLASRIDLRAVGIFGFATYMVALLQAPLRSIVAITIPILSRAWKQKDHKEISRIYKRSSINLLSFSLMLFFCIWLNYPQAIDFFGINPEYHQARWVFFLLGAMTIIEMGTGVNGQIIGTSSYWRFELWTSLLLTVLIIPLSYLLTIKYGLIGPAAANLISFSVYNFVRFWFLWKKFALQPFSYKTVEIIFISLAIYTLTYFSLNNVDGLAGLILRTAVFSSLFITALYVRNISPDLKPVVKAVTKRIKGIVSLSR
ncbi:MAG: lipopolysaccharide biosynthesis protein [Rhizobacter sp.]|nr:lipopolysaccharide biosynthesis protein [Ferruginibacter sp.]